MAIDISEETLIPLAEVPDLPCFAKARPSRRAVRRWAKSGCKGIRLETVTCARKRCTTVPAIQRWMERLSMPVPTQAAVTPSQQRKAQQRARSILVREGIIGA